MTSKLCYRLHTVSVDNKNGVALLLLPTLLDKKHKNGGDCLLQFIEVLSYIEKD